MKDYENSNCALTQQFKSKLKLQPHERSSPSYTMGSKTSLATTSTGSLGPEYFVEEAFNMTSRARSPASYTFGMRNEKLVRMTSTMLLGLRSYALHARRIFVL
jgi:hypothetical protein